VLLSRQSRLRLEAELIRDSALASSGLLCRKLGGPSVFPPQPEGAMQMTQHMNRKWEVSPGDDRYRRGLYTFIWRLAPHATLMAFNAPEGSLTCTRRPRANTPIQALTLLNDEAFVEAAQALALRVLRERPDSDDHARIHYAYQLCLSRKPSDEEVQVLLQLLDNERTAVEQGPELQWFPALQNVSSDWKNSEFVAWFSVARTLLNLDEFITRE
jgi:hypothetical protein